MIKFSNVVFFSILVTNFSIIQIVPEPAFYRVQRGSFFSFWPFGPRVDFIILYFTAMRLKWTVIYDIQFRFIDFWFCNKRSIIVRCSDIIFLIILTPQNISFIIPTLYILFGLNFSFLLIFCQPVLKLFSIRSWNSSIQYYLT